jgi:serine protease Do
VKTDKPLKAVQFGDSDRLRLGEWVIAIGNPFSLGGTVTAGIVSARNRDIESGPYDNYIQTDAAINRGNSGGPLFNLNGEVIGVNTAIYSPSGGSIGIGFAVPSRTVIPVIDQLREFKEVRRGWLGVRIQKVTDDVAEKLNIKPTRGALIAGVDEKGPAKPAGIVAGDVVVSFDGKEVKDMRDLPRIVASTPIGKDVEVVIVHKGKQETRRVKLGRLADEQKQAALTPKDNPSDAKPAVKKALGLDVAGLSDDLRKKHQIDEKVKGVVITAIDPSSSAAEQRLTPGMVIAEVDQQPVNTPAEFQNRIESLQKDGKNSAMLTVLSPSGDPAIVVLGLK